VISILSTSAFSPTKTAVIIDPILQWMMPDISGPALSVSQSSGAQDRAFHRVRRAVLSADSRTDGAPPYLHSHYASVTRCSTRAISCSFPDAAPRSMMSRLIERRAVQQFPDSGDRRTRVVETETATLTHRGEARADSIDASEKRDQVFHLAGIFNSPVNAK